VPAVVSVVHAKTTTTPEDPFDAQNNIELAMVVGQNSNSVAMVVRQNNNSLPIVIGQNNNSLPIVVEPIEVQNIIRLYPLWSYSPLKHKITLSAHCGRAH
jgi:hypothetical protein